jgi:hypothetical protein
MKGKNSDEPPQMPDEPPWILLNCSGMSEQIAEPISEFLRERIAAGDIPSAVYWLPKEVKLFFKTRSVSPSPSRSESRQQSYDLRFGEFDQAARDGFAVREIN